MANRLSKTPERDEIVDKYVRLSHQSDKLRQKLSLSLPASSPLSPPSDYDPYSSPITRRSSASSIQFSLNSAPSSQLSSEPVSSVPEQHTAMAEEDTLHEINQQIKATLTELLNCDSVKHDKTFRAWVQARLMGAEMELKQYRRRRSSMDKKTLEAFSYHVGHTTAFVYPETF